MEGGALIRRQYIARRYTVCVARIIDHTSCLEFLFAYNLSLVMSSGLQLNEIWLVGERKCYISFIICESGDWIQWQWRVQLLLLLWIALTIEHSIQLILLPQFASQLLMGRSGDQPTNSRMARVGSVFASSKLDFESRVVGGFSGKVACNFKCVSDVTYGVSWMPVGTQQPPNLNQPECRAKQRVSLSLTVLLLLLLLCH